MTAIVLPDIDRSTLAELRDRMPSLKLEELDVPSLQDAGRDADRAIDRLLGRSRPSVWPWVAAGVALAAIAGATVALVTRFRQSAWPAKNPAATDSELPAATEPTTRVAGFEALAVRTDDDPFATEGGRP